MAIMGMTTWGVRKPDIRSDMVAEIFSQLRLDFLAYVTWRRILLKGVASFTSYLFDPRQLYLLQVLDVRSPS